MSYHNDSHRRVAKVLALVGATQELGTYIAQCHQQMDQDELHLYLDVLTDVMEAGLKGLEAHRAPSAVFPINQHHVEDPPF